MVGPIKLRQNQRYYVQNLLCQEALDRVVNDLRIDLSQFDSRREGYVDALSFMYAGRTLYEGNLWPHNSELNLSYNGIKVRGYKIQSLGRQRVDLSIGTFCHESGHLLCRFPDLYDYGSRDGDSENGDSEKSSGMGFYCLMSAGNHLNNGRTPAPICAYLRDLVGWCDREIRLNAPGTYELKQGDYGTLMKYETHRPNEYFIFENRTRQGLDAYIPSSGLAIYHCDTLGSNEWQGGTSNRHYQCGLLQADGHLDLETNRNMGDETDLFKQVSGIVLSYTTMPSTRTWDGSDSRLTSVRVKRVLERRAMCSAPKPLICRKRSLRQIKGFSLSRIHVRLVVADISTPGDVIQLRVGGGTEPPTGNDLQRVDTGKLEKWSLRLVF